jgi:hypothetical protein
MERYYIYGIHLQPTRAELTTDSESALREIAVMLEAHPEWRLRLECHTDNTGTKMANMTLSARRASAVAARLTGHGIKRSGWRRPEWATLIRSPTMRQRQAGRRTNESI